MSNASCADGAPKPKRKKGRAFVVVKDRKTDGGLAGMTESVCGHKKSLSLVLLSLLAEISFSFLFFIAP
jgi:hypothetical protein